MSPRMALVTVCGDCLTHPLPVPKEILTSDELSSLTTLRGVGVEMTNNSPNNFDILTRC